MWDEAEHSNRFREEQARLAVIHAYQQMFSTEAGRIVLEDMRKSYGDRTSYVSGDPHGTAFKEGQRDVYLNILNFLEYPVVIQPGGKLEVIGTING